MDPFARKMILWALAFGGAMLLGAGVLSGIYFHNRPECSEAVINEAESPDRRWKAALMERRCGEESPFYLHVNLRAAGDAVRLAYFSGRSEEGEIFLAEEETRNMTAALEWASPNQLTIRCPRCSAAKTPKRQERWGTVTVRYQFQP